MRIKYPPTTATNITRLPIPDIRPKARNGWDLLGVTGSWDDSRCQRKSRENDIRKEEWCDRLGWSCYSTSASSQDLSFTNCWKDILLKQIYFEMTPPPSLSTFSVTHSSSRYIISLHVLVSRCRENILTMESHSFAGHCGGCRWRLAFYGVFQSRRWSSFSSFDPLFPGLHVMSCFHESRW